MGKITVKDAESLEKSGILSKTALEEMQNKGLVSKNKTTVRRFIKTADGKWVEPQLYFRGSKDTTKSKRMESFITDYNKLVEKYTTTRNSKQK
ncbi:MAG: hypothetical protein CME31_07300 [Gimesia sp.]|jgi:hypothetical protein|nr:hypothetical protein [Gimesia sp.]|tara:strand:- start:1701 stop:1979 length:279 start_codon:yes stop_codon:yes gene_type:complete